jgi:hypothetical protein
MEGMPLDVTEDEVQKNLNEYYERICRIGSVPKNRRRELKIRKLNVGKPHFMTEDELKDQELEDIIK